MHYSHYFCLDTDHNLIISDNGAHKIKIFMRDGTWNSLEETGLEPGMFHRPQGIALTNNSKLVVCFWNDSDNILQIFSLW